ncbi:MAG: hypothetical protein JJU45_03155 [Acidimicrobiia bacterium]|nr:hypothetical protein [Acidimicrobiia bacterium]
MAPNTSTKKKGPKALTDEHKAALAEGRAQGRAIRSYLKAIEAGTGQRGRKRSPESIRKRIETLNEDIAHAEDVKRLSLVQERIDLERQLAATEQADDLPELEAEFIKYAAGYSERKGISYAAWREVGVPAAVLRSAGISRSSR